MINDATAFRQIVARSERMTAQIIYKMIPDTEDRRDLAQDIYLKAFRNLANFKHESKLSTWICQIAYNTCIDHLRKKKIRPLFREDGAFEEDDKEAFVSTGPIPDNLVMKKELAGILKTEIDKLPPVYRTLVTLFHTEELSYDEIQEITALPAGTVKSYLSRARKTLRDNLLMNYKKGDI